MKIKVKNSMNKNTQIKGFVGNNNFAFSWYETERSEDNSFIFGQFQIIVNGKKLLEPESERVYDINIIFRYFKNDLEKIKTQEITRTDEDKTYLYLTAERSRGYYTFFEAEQLYNEIKTEKEINDELLKYQQEKPLGYRFRLYYDIEDQQDGWTFYLFRNKDNTKDRFIYAPKSSLIENNGKIVLESQFELGTIEKVISQLPDL